MDRREKEKPKPAKPPRSHAPHPPPPPPESPPLLLGDLLAARHDVIDLAERHGLSAAQLADWIGDEDNRRTIRRLCEVADAQTQVLLCRYRQLAATRLIKMATEEAETGASGAALEVARRACVDMLKMDLKRATLVAGEVVDYSPENATLRDVLYGRVIRPEREDEAEGA